jgi:hypothetical protein
MQGCCGSNPEPEVSVFISAALLDPDSVERSINNTY